MVPYTYYIISKHLILFMVWHYYNCIQSWTYAIWTFLVRSCKSYWCMAYTFMYTLLSTCNDNNCHLSFIQNMKAKSQTRMSCFFLFFFFLGPTYTHNHRYRENFSISLTQRIIHNMFSVPKKLHHTIKLSYQNLKTYSKSYT